MVDQRTVDALLEDYGQLIRALVVLHRESDSDLPFRAWVEVVAVRELPPVEEPPQWRPFWRRRGSDDPGDARMP